MSNNTNGISTEMASQLDEVAQLLSSTVDRLSDAAEELEDIQYKLGEANAKLRRMTYLPARIDSLLDEENYLTASEVSEIAFMHKKAAKDVPVSKLQKLLYNASVANGYPITLCDQEPAFYKTVAEKCLKKIEEKLAGMPSALEGEGE